MSIFKAVLFVLLISPASLVAQGQGTVSATGVSGAPGTSVSIPVILSLNAGVNIGTLQFGVEIIANSPAPALTGTLGFLKDVSLQVPLIETAAGPNLIAVIWSSPPFNPLLSGTKSLGSVTMTVPAGALEGQTYTIRVTTAQATTSTGSVPLTPGPNATLTVVAPPSGGSGGGGFGISDFLLSVSPSSQTVFAGGPSVYTITIRAVGKFAELINFSCSGLPAGGTCDFSPNPSAPGAAALTVTAGPPDPLFGGTIAVIGTSGSLSHPLIVALNIVDFAVSVSPSSQSLTAGATTATSQVSIAAVPSSSGTGLSGVFNLSCGGLPAGANCNFFPNPAPLGAVTLDISGAPSTPVGSVSATVNAASGTVARSAPLNLNFMDFTLTVSPSSQSVSAGGSITYSVSVAGRGNFSSPVNLSCAGLPSGAACNFSPNPAPPGIATLTLSTLASTPVGGLQFTVAGASGVITRSTRAALAVTAPSPPPAFSSASVVNGASFLAGVSPGSIITILGTNLASNVTGIVQASSVPLPTRLMGISVTFNGIPAPLLAVANVNRQEQINLQVPVELAGQTSVTMVVNSNGVLSAPVSVNLLPAAPGIFTTDGSNGAILHASDFRPAAASDPALRGEDVILYATGLGAVAPVVGTGQAAPSAPLPISVVTPVVTVGGVNAIVVFSGLAPGFVGLYQLNIGLPPNVPSGLLDVIIQTGGLFSNAVKLAVQ